MTENKAALTTVQSIEIALASAFASSLINHPFQVLRARFQNSLVLSGMERASYSVFPTEIRVLVRGFSATFFALLSSSTFQMYFKHKWENDLVLTYAAPLAGGYVSALITTPLEGSVLRQSKSVPVSAGASRGGGGGAVYQSWQYYKVHGLRKLYSGYLLTGLRSSIIGSGFAMFMPLMTDYLEEKHSMSRAAALSLSGMTVGTVFSLISQPTETLRIEQQFTANSKNPFTVRQAAAYLIEQHGWRGLFKGGEYRIPRTAPGIFILGAVSQQMERHFLGEQRLE